MAENIFHRWYITEKRLRTTGLGSTLRLPTATTHRSNPNALRFDLSQTKPRAPPSRGGDGVFPRSPETVGLCVTVEHVEGELFQIYKVPWATWMLLKSVSAFVCGSAFRWGRPKRGLEEASRVSVTEAWPSWVGIV